MSALDKVVSAHELRLAAGEARDGDFGPEAPDTVLLTRVLRDDLGQAARVFASCDLSSVHPDVRQAITLTLAAHDIARILPAGTAADWVEATALDVRQIMMLAGGSDSSKPYGDEDYADPGYQGDGKKRYPTTKGGSLNEERIRAAWSYINQGDNAGKYSSSQVATIKGKIKAAAKKAGVNISSDDSDSKKVAATYVMLAAPMTEMPSHTHDAFHGTHTHAHTHLGDSAHGPDIGAHSAAHALHGPFDHGEMPR